MNKKSIKTSELDLEFKQMFMGYRIKSGQDNFQPRVTFVALEM